ncbi:scavenger receptor class B member 1 [Drosophila sechellia]|uniref:GM11770 n=1 Tax=Drosophila sechellia TaxID=7238 RepID=B4IHC0_DROSE|nr:scavenger receptor class B member 1 [Drosophila sechellia]EDW49296.1 GM11770 [Drosophila sechellia]
MKSVQWVKILLCLILAGLNVFLFVLSCGVDYRILVAREYIRFRQEMPTMDSWINSPFGKLKNYVFNVTNAEEFRSGRDNRLKVKEIGPIVYRIVGFNDILDSNETNVRYRKHRYRVVEFLPEESVAPDVLNWTITSTNNVILGAATKVKHTAPLAAFGFDAALMMEDIFVTDSVYYFLWEFTRPLLQTLSRISNIRPNVAVLYNALKEKEEVYTVNIGPKRGIENFFRIETLNGEVIIREQLPHTRQYDSNSCPFNVSGALDNSLFPPFVQPDTPLNIVAIESCRVLPLTYQRQERYNGLDTFRYTLLQSHQKPPGCLDTSYGVKLPDGMFDVSQCVINDAPSAFSMPHFYGSSYNWSQHYEGYTPNAEDHEPYILLEPVTGIPVTEKYRFQSNIPIPDLRRFSSRLSRFSNMMIPSFWYEFEMGQLPGFVTSLMWINVNIVPHVQPYCMVLFLVLALWSVLKAIRVACGDLGYVGLFRKLCGDMGTVTALETKFQATSASPDVAVK